MGETLFRNGICEHAETPAVTAIYYSEQLIASLQINYEFDLIKQYCFVFN